MDLILAYQNELLATIAIIVVIVIYILLKKKKMTSPAPMQEEKTFSPIETRKEPIELHTQEEFQQEEDEKPEPENTLDGKEEGDFGVIEEIKPVQIQEKTIQKRDVPPHGKIVKDNFKEFAGLRVLLAEDNIINQKVILGLLAESGIDIVVANDGAEALEILEKDNNFALVLMDAHMPRIDGFEATRAIRANPDYDHIVVIALSGDTAADDIRKMKESGMSEHLEKPLKMDALYDIFYAYSGDNTNASEGNHPFTQLNIEEGIEISGNDETFYKEILKEFVESYSNAHETLDTLIRNNKIQDADRLLLDIIGVAANIGADKLNRSATNLKSSLTDSDNKKSRLLFTFKEDIENLIQEIKKYL